MFSSIKVFYCATSKFLDVEVKQVAFYENTKTKYIWTYLDSKYTMKYQQQLCFSQKFLQDLKGWYWVWYWYKALR